MKSQAFPLLIRREKGSNNPQGAQSGFQLLALLGVNGRIYIGDFIPHKIPPQAYLHKIYRETALVQSQVGL